MDIADAFGLLPSDEGEAVFNKLDAKQDSFGRIVNASQGEKESVDCQGGLSWALKGIKERESKRLELDVKGKTTVKTIIADFNLPTQASIK